MRKNRMDTADKILVALAIMFGVLFFIVSMAIFSNILGIAALPLALFIGVLGLFVGFRVCDKIQRHHLKREDVEE